METVIIYTVLRGNIMKKLLLFCVMFFTGVIAAMPAENVLQALEIVPQKDSYEIVLLADKAVDIKKTSKSPDKINFKMKNIRASKTLNTIYNNVSGIDSVAVENLRNGISITVQADNAANSAVSFALFGAEAPKIQRNFKNVQKANITDNNLILSLGIVLLFALFVIQTLKSRKRKDRLEIFGNQDRGIYPIPSIIRERSLCSGAAPLSKDFPPPYGISDLNLHTNPNGVQTADRIIKQTVPYSSNMTPVNTVPVDRLNPIGNNSLFSECIAAIYEKSGLHSTIKEPDNQLYDKSA